MDPDHWKNTGNQTSTLLQLLRILALSFHCTDVTESINRRQLPPAQVTSQLEFCACTKQRMLHPKTSPRTFPSGLCSLHSVQRALAARDTHLPGCSGIFWSRHSVVIQPRTSSCHHLPTWTESWRVLSGTLFWGAGTDRHQTRHWHSDADAFSSASGTQTDAGNYLVPLNIIWS